MDVNTDLLASKTTPAYPEIRVIFTAAAKLEAVSAELLYATAQ